MTGKECFIKVIEEMGKNDPNFFGTSEEAEKAWAYFEELKSAKGGSKNITENGIKILQFMQANHQTYNNIFKATDIAVGLFTSGRSVSSSMKKLVNDGYVVKEGKDPVVYSLTESSKSMSLT